MSPRPACPRPKTPYPAAEDALLTEAFGRENVADRTVIAFCSVETVIVDWKAVLVIDANGEPYLLERTVANFGTQTDVGPATQARWIATTMRLLSGVPELVPAQEATSWLEAMQDLRGSIPEWDQAAETVVHERVATLLGQASVNSESEVAQIEAQIPENEVEIARQQAVIASIHDGYQASLEPGINKAINTGTAAHRDVVLRRAFDREALTGKTLVWSMTDLHGDRPWRGCILIEDDGTPHLAEISLGSDGRLETCINRLAMTRWAKLSTLAYWRLMLTDDQRYEPAVEGCAELLNVLKFDLLEESVPTTATDVIEDINELAELRAFGGTLATH
jgi:hypothetical protein